VQNCVGTLRGRLRAAGLRPRIARSADTYLLEIAEDQADVLVFERLCRDADELIARGRTPAACLPLKRALGLWRGRACEDIGADHLAGRTAALEERRLRAIERYVHARGADAEVLEELSSWVHHYPYHEGLHASLAEALQRAGRVAEALHVVRDLKARLRDELAINASPAVEDIERRLLADRNGPADQDPLRSVQAALAQLSAAVDLMATSS
jgi:DNA-binding SARP family transcriptional activator